jgi:hypothetical protein
MDGIHRFALKVQPTEDKPKAVELRPLMMRMNPHAYASLASVAAVLKTSRGGLASDLLEISLQELCDTLYKERKDLAVGTDENGISTWSFYSPSVALTIAEDEDPISFEFAGDSEEDES